ncbi:MAG: glycosyltransferase family 4 protein [Candidatus Cloacimonetes bacterium]|nr:glycosyltransferase family 4 protein [Candidatus Cloacimonadota bacterium]MCF7814856.1 glycosyltransferase family 4 protein [Candidatus Cloacimonadota bacterium]MCF7867517.1 glycosyltransferase family 4 protein [Candidatus Cloacimonadota bacterium]MCF7882981.1 glycosyltransferase family 4 protein [Candidatus Cloacimonadota bacterium]
MKKIKLLHIQLLPVIAGAQNVMLKILENLDKDKYEIYVLSRSGGPLIEKLEELQIKHIPVNSLRRDLSFWDFIAFFKIWWICRKYKYDVVHTHSSKTGFLGRIAAKLAGIGNVIHTSHGFPFNKYQSKPVRSFYMKCEKIAGWFCDKVVFVNQHDRKFVIQNKIINSKKALTIYNGIEVPQKLSPKKNNNRFIIGSSFRFWKQKNPIRTVNAAIEVCKKNSQIEFIFLGDGELLEECQLLVQDAQLQNRIIFEAWVTNIFEHLNKFDAFLLYSKWEGLPVSILEAMSVGLPIIASDIVGNDELVDDNNGKLVSLNEVDKLIDFLITLPLRKDELEKWGKESRKRVEEKFSLKEFVNKYKEIYETKA